jgi:predicted Zn-dependent protease with MMP-like domain
METRAARGTQADNAAASAVMSASCRAPTISYVRSIESQPSSPIDPFEEAVQTALESLPADLRAAISNVEILVEEEPPPGTNYLGLYEGIPLTRRGGGYGMPLYSGALPDKITIYRGPLLRHYGHDASLLTERIRHVVLHEVAHHFGISDERLIEIDRY